MEIYPAIDIRGGRCVRLLQGKADQETEYFADPVDAARRWVETGTRWIHVVDLDGAFTGEPANLPVVEKIAALGAKVQLGGGMRSVEVMQQAVDAGVARVVAGTRACRDEEFVQEAVSRFGGKVAVGIDARDGKVAVKGWVDTTDVSALDLARRVAGLGVGTLIHTDISTDGMLTGPNLAAQEELLNAVTCRVIASGGVSRREDVANLRELAGRYDNLDGVIVGKALYEGRVDLADLLSLVR